MYNLTLQDYNGTPVMDSREVARMVEKPHNDLMKSIRVYADHISNAGDFSLVDFFIPSTYQDGKDETRPCYLITKKGCDMIANKMTGQKGVLFTAAYVTAFEKMREQMAAPALPAPVEPVTALNEMVKLLLPVFDRAGMAAPFQALAMKQIYRRAGIDLPVENLKAERELYDTGAIARKAGVYALSGKPHVQAVGCIIRKLEIPDSEKELVSFEKNGHMGTAYQYTLKVAWMVQEWIREQGNPQFIMNDDGTRQYKVCYDKEAV